MKLPEIIVLMFAAAFCFGGAILAITAVRDPAWGRSGDVAEPYAAMIFMMGVGAVLAGFVAFAVVWMRKR